MSNDRRSGATRMSQPTQLRETRYMTRDEVLRELRNHPMNIRPSKAAPNGAQPRCGAAD